MLQVRASNNSRATAPPASVWANASQSKLNRHLLMSLANGHESGYSKMEAILLGAWPGTVLEKRLLSACYLRPWRHHKESSARLAFGASRLRMRRSMHKRCCRRVELQVPMVWQATSLKPWRTHLSRCSSALCVRWRRRLCDWSLPSRCLSPTSTVRTIFHLSDDLQYLQLLSRSRINALSFETSSFCPADLCKKHTIVSQVVCLISFTAAFIVSDREEKLGHHLLSVTILSD